MSIEVAPATTGAWDGLDDMRWARHWYFDRTDVTDNGGVVDITFDYSEAGMDTTPAKLPAGDPANYRFLRRASATGQFEDITDSCTGGATISGDQVIFSAVDVTCLGSNFTLGTLDNTTSPTRNHAVGVLRPGKTLTFLPVSDHSRPGRPRVAARPNPIPNERRQIRKHRDQFEL